MRVAGLAVDVRASSRPACTVVILDDDTGSIVLSTYFEITSADEDLATQLRHLHDSVESRLLGIANLDRAVVRRADTPPRPSNQEGPRLRLLAEGAVISAVRGVVANTTVGAGLDLGRWHQTSKREVDASAASIVSQSCNGLTATASAKVVQAAAAAIAGLSRSI